VLAPHHSQQAKPTMMMTMTMMTMMKKKITVM
jgi:hypothetical protein